MKEKQLAAIKNILRKNGYKLTLPRLVIIQCLLRNKDHLSIAGIYERICDENPGIGMTTVYRTVDLLLELGIVRILILKNSQPLFELNWPNDHHHHLVCRRCGKVVEFGSCNFKQIAGEIEKVTNFTIEEHTLEAYGLCPKCSDVNHSTEKI